MVSVGSSPYSARDANVHETFTLPSLAAPFGGLDKSLPKGVFAFAGTKLGEQGPALAPGVPALGLYLFPVLGAI